MWFHPVTQSLFLIIPSIHKIKQERYSRADGLLCHKHSDVRGGRGFLSDIQSSPSKSIHPAQALGVWPGSCRGRSEILLSDSHTQSVCQLRCSSELRRKTWAAPQEGTCQALLRKGSHHLAHTRTSDQGRQGRPATYFRTSHQARTFRAVLHLAAVKRRESSCRSVCPRGGQTGEFILFYCY